MTTAAIQGAPSPVLELTDIHKRFGDHEVLRGVSLAAQRGDVISMIGSSGSGKSTLLRCVNLLERPNAGTIAVAGETHGLAMGRDGMLHATEARQLQRIRAGVPMALPTDNLSSPKTAPDNLPEAQSHVPTPSTT